MLINLSVTKINIRFPQINILSLESPKEKQEFAASPHYYLKVRNWETNDQVNSLVSLLWLRTNCVMWDKETVKEKKKKITVSSHTQIRATLLQGKVLNYFHRLKCYRSQKQKQGFIEDCLLNATPN